MPGESGPRWEITCVDVFKLGAVPSAVTVEYALTDEVVLQPEPGKGEGCGEADRPRAYGRDAIC
ncbi:hypothetical protein ACFXC8_29660 [Streptomyces sp. NPDC059441]|jgi:hypothetical protein|uniref:hypothetical protein n=1 Tax=Streptomyces sp. NPDC059441 TaxID=3346829 RepID=UPI0036B57449